MNSSAMKLNYLKSKNFLIDVILFVFAFIIALIFGWIIFGAVTKELIIKSLFMAVMLEIIFRFFFKKRSSANN